MTIPPRVTAVLLLCISTLPAPAQEPMAFVGITVVPMDSPRVLRAQTVVIERGRIASMGPAAAVALPAGMRMIDGSGKYLLPGLADMHVHLRRDSTELLLYIANGVTTIREMAGDPVYLRWREAITAGDLPGPRLYVTSPLIDAPAGKRALAWLAAGTIALAAAACLPLWWSRRAIRNARTRRALAWVAPPASIIAAYLAMRTIVPFPDRLMPNSGLTRLWVGSTGEAARVVRQAARQYDQIKLYDVGLSRAQFDAAIRAAKDAGVHTVGHVPPRLGLTNAFRAGLDELAHIYFLVQDLQVNADTSEHRSMDSAYHARLKDLVEEMRRAGVQITSTLMPLPEMNQRFTDSAAFFARSDFEYRTPAARRAIRNQTRAGIEPAMLSDLQAHMKWGSIAAAELVRAGVPLALGTDTSPRDVVAGFAVHRELDLFVEIGMTPYQAIRTATVNASRLVSDSAEWGMIAAGKRADLLVVDRNPLDDVTVLRRPLGVLTAGRWYDRAALDALLATVVRRRSGS